MSAIYAQNLLLFVTQKKCFSIWLIYMILPFHKLIAALKKKTFNFSFFKSFVDFAVTIMKIMLFSLRARRCEYFDTKVYSNTKAKRTKQREKREFSPKPKNSETAKIMSWTKELLAQLLLTTLAYIHEKLKINLKEIWFYQD